jgi:hypothetical protein
MRILLIVIAIVASLLIAGCGGNEVKAPSLELGGNMPLNFSEKSLTFTVKNTGTSRTSVMFIHASQTTPTSLTISLMDADNGGFLRSTGLDPAEYVANSCQVSYDGTNWSTPSTDLNSGFAIAWLNPGQTFTLRFQRK